MVTRMKINQSGNYIHQLEIYWPLNPDLTLLTLNVFKERAISMFEFHDCQSYWNVLLTVLKWLVISTALDSGNIGKYCV